MKATVYDGRTQREWTPADTRVLSPDTPYAWVDVVADDLADPGLHQLLADLGINDPVMAYLRRSDLAGVFQVIDDRVVGSTWAAPDLPAKHPVYVHVVWSKGSLVTLRSGGNAAIASVTTAIQARSEMLFAHPTVLPGVIMDLILSSVDRRLNDIGDDLYRLDEKILESSKRDQLSGLRDIRDEIAPWARRLPPYLEHVKEALVAPSDLPGIDTAGLHSLQAYEAHVAGTATTVGDLSDTLHSTVQDYQAQLSNQQGNRINQLTVVATIFLPITFMTGYFGMNFQWLSDVTMSFGSWFVLAVLLPILLTIGSLSMLLRDGFGQWMLRRGRSRPPHKHALKG